MPFVSNLKELMRKKNFTYEKLQFESDVAPDTVARARDGRIGTCKLDTLAKLAEALNVDVTELFQWRNEEPHAVGDALVDGSAKRSHEELA